MDKLFNLVEEMGNKSLLETLVWNPFLSLSMEESDIHFEVVYTRQEEYVIIYLQLNKNFYRLGQLANVLIGVM